MPLALPVDRELAKELWLSGLSQVQVAKKLGVKPGTVAQWKLRDGWTNEERVKLLSQSSVNQDVAARVANSAIRGAERVLCKAERIALKDARTCKDVASAIASSYMSARKALGLDDAHPSLHVHYHGAGAPRPIGQSSQPGPVLDVPSSASGQD